MIFTIFFITFFLLICSTIIFFLIWIGNKIKKQAQKKKYFAPIPRPGTFSFVTMEGKVIDILESVVSWHLESIPNINERCFVLGPKNHLLENSIQYLLHEYLGVVWIGLYSEIKLFNKWKWSEFKQIDTQENGVKVPRFEIVAREENVTDFFFQFQYPVVLDDAEIKGNISVRIVSVMIVHHLHPVNAFFLNKDPVALFTAMVQSMLRSYITELNFDEVKNTVANPNTNNDKLWQNINKLNGISIIDGKPDYTNIDPSGLFSKLGMVIVRGAIVNVQAVGEAAQAIESKILAELRGDAKIAEATKEGNALVVAAEKRAEAIKKELKARKKWIRETIVDPSGGPGSDAARVLVAEQVSSKESDITTWIEPSGKDTNKAVISIDSQGKNKKS